MNDFDALRERYRDHPLLAGDRLPLFLSEVVRLSRIEEPAGTGGRASLDETAAGEIATIEKAFATADLNLRKEAALQGGAVEQLAYHHGDIVAWAEAQIVAPKAEGAAPSVEALYQMSLEGSFTGMEDTLFSAEMLDVLPARLGGTGAGLLDDEVAGHLFAKARRDSDLLNTSIQSAMILDFQDVARRQMESAGAIVRAEPGLCLQGAHDMTRVIEAGFDEWRATIRPLLDDERSFFMLDWRAVAQRGGLGADDEGTIGVFLRRAYEQICDGCHFQSDTQASSGVTGFQSALLPRSESEWRNLWFKDGRSWLAYNAQFGLGSLMEALAFGFSRAAKTTSVLEALGARPRIAFKQAVDYAVRDAHNQGRAVDERVGHDAFVSRLIDLADGTADNPAAVHMRQIWGGARAQEAWVELGRELEATVGETVDAMRALNRDGTTFLSTISAQALETLATYGTKARRREAAELFAAACDALIRDTAYWTTSKGAAEARRAYGAVASAMDLNFSHPFSIMGEHALSTIVARRLAQLKERSFEALPSSVALRFSRHGVDAATWDAVRGSAIVEASGGPLLASDGVRGAAAASEGESEAIEKRLRAAYIDRAGVEEAGLDAAVELRVMRFMRQFRYYGAGFIPKVFGRGMQEDRFYYLANSPYAMPRSAATQTGRLIVTLMGLWHLSAVMKAVAGGAALPDDTDAATWRSAFVDSGAAGLFGDVLLRRFFQFGFGDETGPAKAIPASIPGGRLLLEPPETVFAIGRGARPNPHPVSFFSFYRSDSPFSGLYHMRGAMDDFVLYHMRAMIMPDALKRLRRRIERREEAGADYVDKEPRMDD